MTRLMPPATPTEPAATPPQETSQPTNPQELTETATEVAAVEKEALAGPERADQLAQEAETLREKNEVLRDWINDNPLTKGGDVTMEPEDAEKLKNLEAKAEELITRIDNLEKLLKPETAAKKPGEEKKEAEAKAETPEERQIKLAELKKTKAELEVYQRALADYQQALDAWEKAKTTSSEFDNYKVEMERIVEKLFEHYYKTQSLTERDLKSLEEAIQKDVKAVAEEMQAQAA